MQVDLLPIRLVLFECVKWNQFEIIHQVYGQQSLQNGGERRAPKARTSLRAR